jgi:hypothetical protein
MNDSIRHHPGLRTESAALDAMSDAHNELVLLGNAEHDGGEWDGQKLSGAEIWFARKLRAADDKPLADFIELLFDAKLMFDGDSRTARVANAIEKIIDGSAVFFNVRRYLENI